MCEVEVSSFGEVEYSAVGIELQPPAEAAGIRIGATRDEAHRRCGPATTDDRPVLSRRHRCLEPRFLLAHGRPGLLESRTEQQGRLR